VASLRLQLQHVPCQLFDTYLIGFLPLPFLAYLVVLAENATQVTVAEKDGP
jgi:hypothetical protein